jgi:hypothetical protein
MYETSLAICSVADLDRAKLLVPLCREQEQSTLPKVERAAIGDETARRFPILYM